MVEPASAENSTTALSYNLSLATSFFRSVRQGKHLRPYGRPKHSLKWTGSWFCVPVEARVVERAGNALFFARCLHDECGYSLSSKALSALILPSIATTPLTRIAASANTMATTRPLTAAVRYLFDAFSIGPFSQLILPGASRGASRGAKP